MAADPLSLLSESGCHLGSGCGFPAPDSSIFVFEDIWTVDIFGLHVGIGKPLIILFGSILLLLLFFLFAFRRPKLVPRGLQGVGEVCYTFVRDGIARDTIGKEGDRFVPLIFTAFFLIWVLNVVGIVPFLQIPVNSTFAIPVAFALIIYLTWVPIGIRRQGLGPFLKTMTMPPDVPKAMYILLIPIEILSNFIVRPFTHSVRLFANMYAGHMLIATFSVGAWYLLSPSVIGIIGATGSFLTAIGLTLFEVLIQFLQAYVFALLVAVYINDAVHGH